MGKPKKQRPQVDLGTPELRARKMSLRIGTNQHSAPLDVLLAWEKIDQDHYNAAQRLASLRKASFGNVYPSAVSGPRVLGDNDGRPEDLHAFNEGMKAISRAGPLAKYECWQIIIAEEYPGMAGAGGLASLKDWVHSTPFTKHFRVGIDNLKDWWLGRLRTKRAAE